MRKKQLIKILLFLAFLSILSYSCKKQDSPYDLYPLNVGNEFFFTYQCSRHIGISEYTTGNEVWTIVSESEYSDIINYTVERKWNAIRKVAGLTIVIADSIRYFTITESKSNSMINFWGLTFKRIQVDDHFEYSTYGGTNFSSYKYIFKADSGLVFYSYYHPPNHIVNESLSLDSIHLVP